MTANAGIPLTLSMNYPEKSLSLGFSKFIRNVIKLSIGHPSIPLRVKMRYLQAERSRSLFKVKLVKSLLT